MLGTVVSVELAAPPPAAGELILEPLWAEASRLETVFSRYQPESELNRINRAAAGKWVKVGPEMIEVLKLSRRFAELSGGAFDVTVGPLMELWGFFPLREGVVPEEAEIEAARELVDWRSVEVCRERESVRLHRPGMELDLGGVAKGYIVDRLVDFLKDRGVTDALVNAGGDLYCLGNRPGGGPWRIGVEDPGAPGSHLEVLELVDTAAATSGSYHNYFIHDLRRYSHIIDPRTGRPADSPVEAVTVIALQCAPADALATAVFVLGEEAGLDLIERLEDIEILLIIERDDELIFSVSSGWPGVAAD